MADATDYRHMSLTRTLRDVAARQPAPGGGAVVALAGAFGVALAQMVARYATGKKYTAVATEVQAALARLQAAQAELLDLATADQAAYLALVGCSDPAQKAALAEQAARIPLRMAALATATLADCETLLAIGNPHLASDAGVAAALLEAGARAAGYMVKVNLPALSEPLRATLAEDLSATLVQAAQRLAAIQGRLAALGL